MTWSLTLAGLPRAGANSKPHDFKQKVQKTKGFPKTWVLTGKQFKDFRRKKNNSSSDQTTPWKTRSLNATNEDGAFVCNQQEFYSTQLGEKEIRSKMLELCKTRTKKSSLHMLNFYLVSATRHMVIDNDSSTTCRSKFKAPSLNKIKQIMKDFPKTWVSSKNRLKISDKKKQKFPSWHGEQNKGTTKPQEQKLNKNHASRKK